MKTKSTGEIRRMEAEFQRMEVELQRMTRVANNELGKYQKEKRKLEASIKQHKEGTKLLINNKKTITHQDRLIGELTRRVEFLEDSEAKRQHWLAIAKRDAGYDVRESFDKVWAEILAKAKNIKTEARPKSWE